MVDTLPTHAHGNRSWRPIPIRRQPVRFALLQVVDDDNCAIGLISVFSKFGPGNLSAIVAKARGVGGTVFPRGDLLSILSLKVDDVDLEKSDHFPGRIALERLDSRSAWCATREAAQGPTWYTRRASWKHQSRPSLQTARQESSRQPSNTTNSKNVLLTWVVPTSKLTNTSPKDQTPFF